ncbi:hypothetical protein L9F63_026290, partial [Diploptera punctata]
LSNYIHISSMVTLKLPLVLELVSLLSFDKMGRQLTLEQRIYVFNMVIFFLRGLITAPEEIYSAMWHENCEKFRNYTLELVYHLVLMTT